MTCFIFLALEGDTCFHWKTIRSLKSVLNSHEAKEKIAVSKEEKYSADTLSRFQGE